MSQFGAVQYARARDGASIAYQATEGVGPAFLWVNTPGAPPLPVRRRIDIYANGPPRFAGERPAVTFDWRGSGYSAEAGPPESLNELVLDLEAVTRAVGRPVDALSYGTACFAATVYASEHPDGWRSLVLSDPSLRADTNVQAMVQSLVDRTGSNFSYIEHLLLLASRSWKPTADDNTLETAYEWARELTRETFAAYRAVEKQVDLTSMLPRIAIPVLVTNNLGHTVDAAVAALLPNGRLLPRSPIYQRPDYKGWSREDWDAHLGVLFDDTQPQAHREEQEGASDIDEAPSNGDTPARLSLRELEVLRLVARGLRNQEIADELVISRPTVSRHISNILDKTGARSRIEAVNYAVHHRLFD